MHVFHHDAAIHDDVDAAGFGAGGGFAVDDSLLNPEVGEAELKHLVDDGRDELREAEDIDDVGLDGEFGEASVGSFAEDFDDGWVDGVDFVTVLLHVGGDVVAWFRGDFGEADDGDGARVFRRGRAEHVADEFGFVPAQSMVHRRAALLQVLPGWMQFERQGYICSRAMTTVRGENVVTGRRALEQNKSDADV